MKHLTTAILVCFFSLPVFAETNETVSEFYTLKAKLIDGKKEVDFKDYKGKVLLIVNTASKCGFTPQYKDLQKIYSEYKEKGFLVLGFPSNDFGEQEPAPNAEVKHFCEINYGVNFPLFEKGSVKGKSKQPVFQYLTEKTLDEVKGEISWNFTKFLVDRKGNVVERFASLRSPDSAKVRSRIEELLKQ